MSAWQKKEYPPKGGTDEAKREWAGSFPAQITTIRTTARGRYSVYLEEQYFDVFDGEIIDAFHLKKDLIVEESLLREAQEAQALRTAKHRAYSLLSYRDHSERELYDKLCQKTSPQAAAATVEQLVASGFLDDEKYAESLARCFLEQKCFSYRKSLFEMKRKGISEEIACEALEALAVSPADQLRRLIEKKYARRDLHDFKERKKVGDSLARMGFAYADIRAALEAVIEQELWEDDTLLS